MQGHRYDFRIGERVFTGGTHVMAIINLTPDSFYAPSRASGDEDIVARARRCLLDGADVLDIGGQSTRPGAARVGVLEELARTLPAVRAIKSAIPDCLLSVDTFYPEVAEACLAEGTDMINDVSGVSDEMARVVATGKAAVCAMHDRRNSKVDDLMLDKQLGLTAAVDKLLAAGVEPTRIMLDGGIGFNKGRDEDMYLLNNYSRLINLFEDYPFLLGASRKSVFGGEPSQRLSATLDSTAQAVRDGALFVRVHDVKENVAVIASLG